MTHFHTGLFTFVHMLFNKEDRILIKSLYLLKVFTGQKWLYEIIS